LFITPTAHLHRLPRAHLPRPPTAFLLASARRRRRSLHVSGDSCCARHECTRADAWHSANQLVACCFRNRDHRPPATSRSPSALPSCVLTIQRRTAVCVLAPCCGGCACAPSSACASYGALSPRSRRCHRRVCQKLLFCRLPPLRFSHSPAFLQ